MSQRQESEPEHLDGTITFINMTSKLIDTFADTILTNQQSGRPPPGYES